MKLNNIYVIITSVLLCLMTSVSDAQDLIKNTQRGVRTSNMAAPNLVAKEIAKVKAKVDFELVTPFQMSKKDMRVKHQDYVSEEVYLALNTKELSKIFDKKRDHITMDIPVSNGRSFQVELMKVNILSDGFKVTTSSGRVLYTDDFPGIFYRGIIKDAPNSIVSISVFEGQIKGLISDDNGNYILGEIKDQPDVYILYNDRDLKVSSNFSCGVTDEMEATVEEVREQQHSTKSMNSGCIDVYIEADFATYQSFSNSEPDVINFATSLFNQVSTLYTNENISVQISEIFVWDTPDPYIADENTSEVLGRFGENRASFNGNLAHFISTRPLGGGIAWVDILCGNLPYAVSANMESDALPMPTYNWNTYVFAHEMGHNFGSSHTHRCVWNNNNTQIDDCGNHIVVNNGFDDNQNGIVDDISEAKGAACYSDYPNGIIPAEGGTIMSYCHLNGVGIDFNLGFGPQPGDLIRNRYNSATCKTDCDGPCPPCNNGTTCSYTISNNSACSYDVFWWNGVEFTYAGIVNPNSSLNTTATDGIQFAAYDSSNYDYNTDFVTVSCASPNYNIAPSLCSGLATCTDGIQNQGEGGIDCDGPCSPCANNICNYTVNNNTDCEVRLYWTDNNGSFWNGAVIPPYGQAIEQIEDGDLWSAYNTADNSLITPTFKVANCSSPEGTLPASACNGSSDCLGAIGINGNISGYTEVENNIISPIQGNTATVNTSSSATFNAGRHISLNPGFTAEYGSVFHAFIDGCDNAGNKTEITEAPITISNYPNPFTGQTTIEYNLPDDSQVMLVVTDLTGKQIAVLVNQEQKTKGINTVSFDGSNYPAGMYYYTIQAGEYVGTEKMILVK